MTFPFSKYLLAALRLSGQDSICSLAVKGSTLNSWSESVSNLCVHLGFQPRERRRFAMRVHSPGAAQLDPTLQPTMHRQRPLPGLRVSSA